jgi:hypothetical protein
MRQFFFLCFSLDSNSEYTTYMYVLRCLWTNFASFKQCCGSRIRIQIRIRIQRVHMFLCLLDPDPDPSVRGMDPDPDLDPSITKQEN